MDTRTGKIYTMEELHKMFGDDIPEHFKEMVVSPTLQQLSRKPPKIGRNELCPCGSGKKFKHCCLDPLTKAIRERMK